MKFVNEPIKDSITEKEIKEFNNLQKELDKERSVQLGNKETKQPEEDKTHKTSKEEKWVDGITTTLVNFRETNDPNGRIIDSIKGGEIVKISDLLIYGNFRKAKVGTKTGFINKNYVKEI